MGKIFYGGQWHDDGKVTTDDPTTLRDESVEPGSGRPLVGPIGGPPGNYHDYNTPLEQFERDEYGRPIKPVAGTQWGIPGYWNQKANQYAVDPSRANRQQARGMQQQSLGDLYDYATGKKSFAQDAFGVQRQRMAAQATSMGKSMVGGYNPNAARTAQHQAAAAGSQLAPGLAAAKQAEQSAALQNYLTGANALRSGEQDWWGANAAWNQAKGSMNMGWHGLGAMDVENQRNASIKYRQLANKALLAGGDADRTTGNQYLNLAGEGSVGLGKITSQS